ncbi:hypothetical protein LDENG_00276610 [Lucifuga dentata]|nr:hypothetical protein LDENG_00276610 [Lucifuga dentata]
MTAYYIQLRFRHADTPDGSSSRQLFWVHRKNSASHSKTRDKSKDSIQWSQACAQFKIPSCGIPNGIATVGPEDVRETQKVSEEMIKLQPRSWRRNFTTGS